MEKTVPIPAGVAVEKLGDAIAVKGPKGTLQREFRDPRLEITVAGDVVRIATASKRKSAQALAGTFASHIQNMILGVSRGFEARLKVVYSHFPMKVGVEGSSLVIQNFLGERSSRQAQILDGVKVEVKKDDIIVSGLSKEDVGQTAGRIESAAKVTRFDRRVFQDGIHLVAKATVRQE